MGPPPTGQSTDVDTRQKQLHQYRTRLATALSEEDDPLSVYHQFVEWTIKNYGEDDPNSGLFELLKEATKQFKDDPLYKTDLRYLKLWSLYARQVDKAGAISIYEYLVANGIGTSYAALYEEYAALLEGEGRRKDAEAVYRSGIKRNVRPLERLKNRYKEFQSRSGISVRSSPKAASSSSSSKIPPKSQSSKTRSSSSSSPASSSAKPGSPSSGTFNSTAASRYALMLAPPAPGKRPEKLRFNLSLLFTDEGVEYSIQEARARSMGLLGKKWGPPPASERFPSHKSARVDFNDDGQKSTRLMGKGRKSLLGGTEPTVTINTKEALADVFGMFNSPDKTTKLLAPGSKHAPLKKIEPVTPMVPPRATFSHENENAMPNSKIAMTPFKPLVDENLQSNKTPSIKFTPFVDPNLLKTPFAPFVDENVQSGKTPSAKFTPLNLQKTPFTTPRPALSLKDTGSTPSHPNSNENVPYSTTKPAPLKPLLEENGESVFSKVFTPVHAKPVPLAPLRDVFTDDHGKPQPKPRPPMHERAKSHHDVLAPIPEGGIRPSTFMPFVDEDAKTPFKVFSRPPEQGENAFTPKTPSAALACFQANTPAFTPFRDNVAFTPFADKPKPTVEALPEPAVSSQSEPETSRSVDDDEDTTPEERVEEIVEEEQYEDGQSQYEEGQSQYEEHSQYEDEDVPPEQYDHQIPLEEYEEGDSFQEVPLGGRFGQFNVMTPITERTFEFTMSTRGGSTPSDHAHNGSSEDRGSPSRSNIFIPRKKDEHGAIEAAERLAAELRESKCDYEEGEEETYEGEEVTDAEPIEPLRLSADTVPHREDPAVAIIEERTGTLSLVDTLTLSSKFRPSNPCNPFDTPILSNLLSRIPTDPHFHDLRNRNSELLDVLQRFTKKKRKNSGNSSNTGILDVSECYSIILEGHRFSVSEKLGEGGFGCVFKARDQGTLLSDDEDEDEDEDLDEEEVSLVAIKIVKPGDLWEYHALRRLHTILPASLRRSLVLPHALYSYADESILVMDLCPQGMLLNIVNNAISAGVSQAGACLDELLVMFFAIELLRLIEGMHNAGFIHGDLKIDNCCLRVEEVPGGASAWSSAYQPSGEGGWSYKGLKVIDFGRSIDTRLFPPGQQFIAGWATDDRDCFEVRENRPWTFQTDYFGLAGIIYCMLFGKYIEASSVAPASTDPLRYKISTPFKRYWQTDLWNRIFDVLLNPCLVRPNGALPLRDELGALREEMETWLKANCNRSSGTLKGLLKKVEMSCYR